MIGPAGGRGRAGRAGWAGPDACPAREGRRPPPPGAFGPPAEKVPLGGGGARLAISMKLDILGPTMETKLRDPALDARFQALSDEKRLRVLQILRDGERCVCDLAEALDVGQSLLSFHLKTLKEAGLVRARRDGRWVHYSLDDDGLRALRDRLDELVEAAEAPSRPPVPRCC